MAGLLRIVKVLACEALGRWTIARLAFKLDGMLPTSTLPHLDCDHELE